MKIIILFLPQKSLLVTFAVNFSCCNIFTAKVITKDYCGKPIFPTKNALRVFYDHVILTLTLNRAGVRSDHKIFDPKPSKNGFIDCSENFDYS